MAISRECFGIETVGALREILDGVPDDTPISDCGGEPLDVWFFKEHGTERDRIAVE